MPIAGSYTAGDATTYKDCKVEVDLTPASSSYATISSWANEVTVSGEDVPTTETYPFDGDPIVFAGNKRPVTVTVSAVFTEGSTDPFHNIRAKFEAGPGDPVNVRFSPSGGATGAKQFTTSGGKLTACPVPSGSGDGSSASLFTFVITADGLAQSTVSA